ncbi:hypothetical protein SATMO3_26500 [Sporomusa aerivorans]
MVENHPTGFLLSVNKGQSLRVPLFHPEAKSLLFFYSNELFFNNIFTVFKGKICFVDRYTVSVISSIIKTLV